MPPTESFRCSHPTRGATWVFIANENRISGLKLGLDGAGNPQLAAEVPNAWIDHTGGTSPVMANGILYYAWFAGVRALDATTGDELWRGTHLGNIHWESPIVVNGRLYVSDENRHLLAYEPGPEPYMPRRTCARPASRPPSRALQSLP
jgi:outer membrane protein assembly factor BamB